MNRKNLFSSMKLQIVAFLFFPPSINLFEILRMPFWRANKGSSNIYTSDSHLSLKIDQLEESIIHHIYKYVPSTWRRQVNFWLSHGSKWAIIEAKEKKYIAVEDLSSFIFFSEFFQKINTSNSGVNVLKNLPSLRLY